MHPMEKLRVAAKREIARRDQKVATSASGLGRLRFWAAYATRGVREAITAARQFRVYASRQGAQIARQHGVSIAEQARQALICYRRFGIMPKYYYFYQIWGDFERAGCYVTQTTWARLIVPLVEAHAVEDGNVIRDKQACAQHLIQHGLPTIPTLVEIEEGSVTFSDAVSSGVLPEQDLFSKPRGKQESVGIQRWRYKGNGRYENDEGVSVSAERLVEWLAAESKTERLNGEAVLLQPCMRNHPHIEALTGPTLSVARIFTGRKYGGKAKYLAAFFCLALGDNVAAAFLPWLDTVAAPVEEETGTLGKAYVKDLKSLRARIDVHPVTGKQIEGFRIPDWEKAKSIVVEAHDTLGDMPVIGWDVGFGPQGPFIVEANKYPGIDAMQILHQKSWGEMGLVDVLVSHVEHGQLEHLPSI